MRAALRVVALLTLGGGCAAAAAAQPPVNADAADHSPSAEQQPGSSAAVSVPADAGATGVVAKLRFDLSDSSQGSFMQLVPDIGYQFSAWGVDFGVPLDSSSISAASAGAAAHRGIGDAYLSVYYAVVDSDTVSLKSTLIGTAPTGDSTMGFGTGQATWNWTNHFERDFDRASAFLDAGVGNSLNPSAALSLRASGSRSGRLYTRGIMIPTHPYTTIGKQADLDAGVDVRLGHPLSLGLSVYDIIPCGGQTVLSRFVPQPNLAPPSGQRVTIPVSRSTRGQRFFELNPVTEGTSSLTRDHGLAASVTVAPVSSLDVTITYSRSIPMQLDVLTLSIGTNLTGLFRKTSD